MIYLRPAKFLSLLLVVILLLLCATRPVPVRADTNGVRVDLPPGGEISVSNPRGSITIEVWSEQHVAVAATTKGVKLKKSPVSIKRTEQLLSISVSPLEVGMLTRVDLTLHIPERSRAKIVATTGEIKIQGMPAALTAQTGSANIRAEFSMSSNADIQAEAPNGKVIYALDSLIQLTNTPPPADKQTFHLRTGTGSKPVHLRSERGQIILSPSLEEASAPPVNKASQTPVLIGGDKNRPGAGTPSTPLTSPEEIDEGDIVRVDTELVTLNVSVIDRGTNRGLKGLLESDFKLFEDSQPQQISHFESANAPFNLVLLIDLSLSTQDKLALIRDAALQFVAAARPEDRIGIVTFTHEPVIVSRLTSDRAALRQRINAIEKPKGSTNVYDSVAFVMNEVFKEAKDSRRNAIVLMSDGLDSVMPNVPGPGSTISHQELLSRAREFDGVIYSLWLNVETEYSSLSPLDIQPETYDLAHDEMEQLAEAGGGLFYEVEKLEDLADAYERVVADLGTVYSLSYRPVNRLRDGKWRAIRVAVARPNAVARGKRGYYAN